MKKSLELVIRKKENFEVVRYIYYFEGEKEMNQFVLNSNEKLIMRSFCTGDEFYPCMIQVEITRNVETKHIYDADEYAPFIKNLQKTQYNFSYNSEWYNNWINYINKIPYDEACALIELLNEFYVAGKENIW